ncbi:MAG: ribonuclease HII [Faecalibacterium sp.]
MKRRSDEEISAPLYQYDAAMREQYGCFAGVDEAGRGPLCGPVCVAACILDPANPVFGINDSKKLTEKKREELFDQILEKALAYRIIFVGPEIIDRDNILNATLGGMRQAVEELEIVPNLVLVDGNRCPPGLAMPAQPVVKGDATSASIGAASILAKVSRDRFMMELDRQYPQYQLAKHKGYPTRLHYELIEQYGIQPFYRRSFLKKQGYWPEGRK